MKSTGDPQHCNIHYLDNGDEGKTKEMKPLWQTGTAAIFNAIARVWHAIVSALSSKGGNR